MSQQYLIKNQDIHTCNIVYCASSQFSNQHLLKDVLAHTNLTQKLKNHQRTRGKSQIWSSFENNKIFSLYNQYGSQWKIIQSEFPGRNANSIKNHFYTVIRILLKLLFKWHAQICQKIPHQIPSKLILKFYQGRQQFSVFKGLAKKILKRINYDLESKEIRTISQEYSQQISQIFHKIFNRIISQEQKQQKHIDNFIKEDVEAPQTNFKILDQENNKITENISQRNIKSEETNSNTEQQIVFSNSSNQIGPQVYFIPIQNFYEFPLMQTYFLNF